MRTPNLKKNTYERALIETRTLHVLNAPKRLAAGVKSVVRWVHRRRRRSAAPGGTGPGAHGTPVLPPSRWLAASAYVRPRPKEKRSARRPFRRRGTRHERRAAPTHGRAVAFDPTPSTVPIAPQNQCWPMAWRGTLDCNHPVWVGSGSCMVY